MRGMCGSLACLLVLTGAAGAQTVELRIVEEDSANASLVVNAPPAPGTTLTTAVPRGNYAVQARVTPGPNGNALAGFGFDIVIPNEADTSGVLAKLRINANDGTYYSGAATIYAAVGVGGMARPFTYLAGINAAFNGSINVSSGTFTNQPGQQEIGQITGSTAGSALLSVPNIDPNGESNPATWAGYGVGAMPPNGATASLDPALAGPYFAAGQFIDIYRFRYTTTSFAGRQLTLTLQHVGAQVFTQFVYNTGSWTTQSTIVAPASITVTPLTVAVAPPPGTCCGPDGSCQFIAMSECPTG
ncbi:MAG TPA: hypothetical protein VHC70_07030, partial [Phycisphaerales bacterium]|nr:hypothetical protein [Phycisphaerales bacterium]